MRPRGWSRFFRPNHTSSGEPRAIKRRRRCSLIFACSIGALLLFQSCLRSTSANSGPLTEAGQLSGRFSFRVADAVGVIEADGGRLAFSVSEAPFGCGVVTPEIGKASRGILIGRVESPVPITVGAYEIRTPDQLRSGAVVVAAWRSDLSTAFEAFGATAGKIVVRDINPHFVRIDLDLGFQDAGTLGGHLNVFRCSSP